MFNINNQEPVEISEVGRYYWPMAQGGDEDKPQNTKPTLRQLTGNMQDE